MPADHSLAPDQRAGYWDTAYDPKGEDGVSWYQAEPTVTLELFEGAQVAHVVQPFTWVVLQRR